MATKPFAVSWLVALLAMAADARAETLPGTIHRIGIDLGNVENGIRRLEKEIENPVAQSRFYSLEKRLVDARVYFDLKNYPKAAVLFIDALQSPDFQRHRDRSAVLFQLGYSLYMLRNYLAAREYLAELAQAGGGMYYDKALRYLIEIGLSTRNATGLADAVDRVGRVPQRTPETQYAYAKGLYRLGRSREALEILGSVAPAAAEYTASQYYTGVIRTELGQLEAAATAFQRVVAQPAATDKARQIRELAHLGLGRLFLELKDHTKAVDSYQEIDRNSEHFHTALYEMTWAYVNGKQYDKALNALEILLLTVSDEHLATQANILRGRLNILLDQTDLAVETYNEIVERFAPLRQELDTFSSRRDNLTAYFKWLLRRHSDTFQLGAVLSDRASRWIESDEQLREVVSVFDDMSHQHGHLKESEKLVEELERALSSGNRVEVFPKLRNAWMRIVVSENALLRLSQLVLDAGGMLARARMSADEQKRLDGMLERRRQLEQQFASAPQSMAELTARTSTVQQRYADIKRESFLLESSLKQVRDELVAMEKWLNEARFGAGDKKLPKGQEEKLTRLLTAEKARLEALHNELLRLKERIGQETAAVGAGDFVSTDETALRRRLLELHREEDILLGAVLGRLVGSEADQARQLQDLRARIVDDFKRLGWLLQKIDRAVASKVGEYKREIAAEKELLSGYKREVVAFERDSRRVASEIGVPLFRLAHTRITDVVLEADLGIVDVAWKRKKAESDKIVNLQKEQSEQLERLESTMKLILKD